MLVHGVVPRAHCITLRALSIYCLVFVIWSAKFGGWTRQDATVSFLNALNVFEKSAWWRLRPALDL